MHWSNSEVKTYICTIGNLSGKGVKTFKTLDAIISFNFQLNTT